MATNQPQRVSSVSDLLARYAAGERDFRRADLSGARLSGADLSGARLSGADLIGADLIGADLIGADLIGADLRWADLRWADLSGARLRWADLSGADLSGARLSGADLRWARLIGADLSGADLDSIKQDVLALCRLMPAEVPGLLAALEDGRVDGSIYAGECACLVGTLANCRRVDYHDLPNLVPGLEIDSDSPRERWFLGIRRGDTPATNPVSAITAEWLRELVAELDASETTRESEASQ